MEGKGGASGQPVPPLLAPLRQRGEGDAPRLLPLGNQAERRNLNLNLAALLSPQPRTPVQVSCQALPRRERGPAAVPGRRRLRRGRRVHRSHRGQRCSVPGSSARGKPPRGACRSLFRLEGCVGTSRCKSEGQGSSGKKRLEERSR